jgi:GNAT superfamily N-acetyltransferase
MFFLFTTQAKFPATKLRYLKLADNPELLNQAAEWGEKEWGYLRVFPGIDKRKALINDLKSNFYIAMYDKQPVGMFALVDKAPLAKKLFEKNPQLKMKKLTYFYVHESLRGLGIGKAMLKEAKRIAAGENAIIVLDTLKPNLNSFYEKSGAKVLCEDKSLGAPTTLLRI